jgi:hypothetical protein
MNVSGSYLCCSGPRLLPLSIENVCCALIGSSLSIVLMRPTIAVLPLMAALEAETVAAAL